MVIQKVINNNVISAYDENQQEVVIMGKGIGFKAHMGDAIDGFVGDYEAGLVVGVSRLGTDFLELAIGLVHGHVALLVVAGPGNLLQTCSTSGRRRMGPEKALCARAPPAQLSPASEGPT